MMDETAQNATLAQISKNIFGDSARLQIVDPKSLVLLKQNARFFKKDTFRQLVENIKADKRLSSVPLCRPIKDGRLEVLSGNHRVKASVEAGLEKILVIVLLENLDESRRIAIQLSHNALVGQDDQNILAELWAKIDDINTRLYAGLSSDTLNEIKKNADPCLHRSGKGSRGGRPPGAFGPGRQGGPPGAPFRLRRVFQFDPGRQEKIRRQKLRPGRLEPHRRRRKTPGGRQMSFVGAINALARQAVVDFARRVPYPALVVGAGNFTVPAALRTGGYAGPIRTCDISLYASAMGTYLAGNDPLTVREKHDAPEHLRGLLNPETPLDLAASIALLFDLREVWQAKNPYQVRILKYYTDRWPALMEETRRRLSAYREHIAPVAFESRCGMAVLDGAAPEQTVFAFPPTYKRGYERLEKLFSAIVEWSPPAYAEMTDQTMTLYEKIARFAAYFVVLEKDLPDVYHIIGKPTAVLPRGRGKTYIVNKTPGKKWVVKKRIPTASPGPVLDPDRVDISGANLTIALLSLKQTLRLNELYLAQGIDYFEGGVGVSLAFLLDGRIAGKADFCPSAHEWKIEPAGKHIYVTSDLAVPSRTPKLSKLILLALISADVKRILDEHYLDAFRYATTTAFSTHPVSMKYRGVFKLHTRKETAGGYLLNYFAPFGDYPLKDALRIWEKRYG